MEICAFREESNETIFFLLYDVIVLGFSDLPLASKWFQSGGKVNIFMEYFHRIFSQNEYFHGIFSQNETGMLLGHSC